MSNCIVVRYISWLFLTSYTHTCTHTHTLYIYTYIIHTHWNKHTPIHTCTQVIHTRYKQTHTIHVHTCILNSEFHAFDLVLVSLLSQRPQPSTYLIVNFGRHLGNCWVETFKDRKQQKAGSLSFSFNSS